ncbi:hypothetical protein KAFR_0D04640 [Kazachstania africana CBS 2517]|uniref:RING-type E3 ubiquitin transferase n=1 Tax=Kazachstania africana (strain ATCC 22294 / BCRC 22015 / CBS 2517 / CECT 1963 / NBRC 1671 / NRRL Y-8276) TaxID=1071382 RepID=H2AUR2_KAZAF|nr:hypothetical protein KAFR_0D04640 [Kazachstania africana CBS 2517]CCF58112.1 hypothetical protein KAFR_0D04640 [Kazachstania africana CBS 2517]
MTEQDGSSSLLNAFAFWQPDKDIRNCLSCQSSFNILVRRHHCRCCGGIFCGSCASKFARYNEERVKVVRKPTDIEAELPPYRTCDACYQNMMQMGLIIHPWRRMLNMENSDLFESTQTTIGDSITERTPSVSVTNTKDDSTNELTTDTVISAPETSSHHGHDEEENHCPICNFDFSEFSGNEEIEDHIKECLTRAERAQQHQTTSVASGLSNDQENNCPTNRNRMLVYKVAKDNTKTTEEYPECPICFEEMIPGDKVGRLECLCVFHYKCIKSWFNKRQQKLKSNNKANTSKNFCPFHDAIL